MIPLCTVQSNQFIDHRKRSFFFFFLIYYFFLFYFFIFFINVWYYNFRPVAPSPRRTSSLRGLRSVPFLSAIIYSYKCDRDGVQANQAKASRNEPDRAKGGQAPSFCSILISSSLLLRSQKAEGKSAKGRVRREEMRREDGEEEKGEKPTTGARARARVLAPQPHPRPRAGAQS